MTVLLSKPPGEVGGESLRKMVAAAGFAVADHTLGSAAVVDFAPLVVALIDVGDRAEVAVAQTRRWRAELGDEIVPVMWVASPELVAMGLDAGADVALPRPVEALALAAQLRALARGHATAARVAVRAAESRLIGDQLKNALTQLQREQDLAGRIHAGLLPSSFPQVGSARFNVCYRSRSRCGGDFYNVRQLDKDHVGFFVGDVIGTGASALLGVFVQQSAVFSDGARIEPPDEVLAGVNRQLAALGADDLPLVAMLVCVLNATTGALTLARAGLPAPVHVPARGNPRAWAVPGPFLGTENSTYQQLTATLAPGDRLLIGTDGTRSDGDPGGTDSLLEAATKHSTVTGPDFVDVVARELLLQVRHADDFTLLGVEMKL